MHASKALPSASAGVNEKNLRGFKLRLASPRPDGRHSALSYWQFGVSKELRYLAPSEVVRRKRKFRFPELEGPVEARNAQKSLFLNAPKFKRRTAEPKIPPAPNRTARRIVRKPKDGQPAAFCFELSETRELQLLETRNENFEQPFLLFQLTPRKWESRSRSPAFVPDL